MATDNSRIIDLDQLNSNEQLSIENLIFSEEARTLCDNSVAAKENNKASCFFIHGSRGAGKSTFLKAVSNHLVKGDNPDFSLLAEIDPTRLGRDEHFLLYVISEVLKLIRKQDFASKEMQPKLNEYSRDIRRLIKSMAEGLMSLSAPFRSNSELFDASIFLESGLERCSSSAGLQERFSKIMEKLYELNGNKKFLLTIDDSDMNPDKCYEIIECIRKYLLDRHLVFVFSGDFKLYSMVIRGHQMNHFTMAAWQYDTPNTETRLQMLTMLGAQYMLKMFPVSNRLNLPNLEELLSDNGRSYSLSWKQGKEYMTAPIQNSLRYLLEVAVGEDGIPLWKSVLYSLSLRSILQMLNHYIKHSMDREYTCSGQGKVVAESIMQTFSSVLLSANIDYNAIRNGNLYILLAAVIRLAGNPKSAVLMEKGYSTQFSLIEQICSLYLNAEIARQTVTLSRKLLWFGSLYPYRYAHGIVGDAVSLKMPEPILQNGGYKDSLKALFNKEPTIYAQWGADITAMMVCHSDTNAHRLNNVVKIPQNIGKLIFTDSIVTDDALPVETALRNAISTTSKGTKKEYWLSVFNLVSIMINCLEIVLNTEQKADKKKKLDRLYAVLFSASLPADSPHIAEGKDTKPARDALHPTFIVNTKSHQGQDEEFLEKKRLNSHLAERVYEWANKWAEKQSFTHALSYTSIWEQYLEQKRVHESDFLYESGNQDIAEATICLTLFIHELTIFGKLMSQLYMEGSEYSYSLGEESPLLTFPLIEDLLNVTGKEDQYFSQYGKYLR